MTNLKTQLQNAEGASRELDLLVWVATEGATLANYALGEDNRCKTEVRAEFENGDWQTVAYTMRDPDDTSLHLDSAFDAYELPKFTASLDACQDLEQRLFPNSDHQISNLHDFSHVGVCLNGPSPAYGTCKFGDEPYRTCRAWLAALLTALEGGEDHG